MGLFSEASTRTWLFKSKSWQNMEGTMVLSEQKTARNGRLHQLAISAATIKILLTGALTGVLTGALSGVIVIIIIFSIPSNSTSPIWSNAIEHLQTLLHCRRHVLIHKLCKCSINWYGLACLMHQIMGWHIRITELEVPLNWQNWTGINSPTCISTTQKHKKLQKSNWETCRTEMNSSRVTSWWSCQ